MIRKKVNRNVAFLISIWVGILPLISGCNSSSITEIQCKIDRIADKWVPDQREGICNITALNGNGGAIILQGETTIPKAKEEIIDTLSKPGIILIDSVLLFPDTLSNKKYMGLVSISVTNLKKSPCHQSELVSQAILGTPVMILKIKNSWLLVQTPDRYIAWAEKSSINMVSASEMNGWRQSDRLIYLNNAGLIYSATDESGIIGDLVAGSIIVKTGESKGYNRVKSLLAAKRYIGVKDDIGIVPVSKHAWY